MGWKLEGKWCPGLGVNLGSVCWLSDDPTPVYLRRLHGLGSWVL